MDEEQVRAIVKIVAQEMALGYRNCEFCESDAMRREHRLEHEFIQELMKISERWEGIKWDTLRDILKWISRVTILAMITGLIIMAIKSGNVQIK